MPNVSSGGCSNGYDLDLKNPGAKAGFEHVPPEHLADDIIQEDLRIADILREMQELLGAMP